MAHGMTLKRAFVLLGGSGLTVVHTALAGCVLVCLLPVTQAHADRLTNDVAVFAALDKVTARIKELKVPLNETVEFGALKVTARICYSRPPTEPPKTTSFVEIVETELDGQVKPLFAGWMFAESPGLNAVEHPVFDVWLTGCEKPKGGLPQDTASAQPQAEDSETQPVKPVKRRPRRRRIRR